MIQLANDPNASRHFRPSADDGKGHGLPQQRRNTHAWPFISRHAGRPAPQNTAKNPSDSGS